MAQFTDRRQQERLGIESIRSNSELATRDTEFWKVRAHAYVDHTVWFQGRIQDFEMGSS